jgi:aryl-alcohol dehydrogenase-like predicted oxidoreductase
MLTDSRAASGDPVVAALRCFLAARGISLTHAALAWVLARPGVTAAIVGASRPEQLADTLRGPGCVLGDEERLGCDAVWQSISRTISSKH